QQIFQQNAQGKRQASHVLAALPLQMFEPVDVERLRADAQFVASAKRIACGDGHLQSFRGYEPSMITELAARGSQSANATCVAPLRYTGRAVKILLLGTYELGRQPFGLASPAAWLRNRGHFVHCCDLSRQPLDEPSVRDSQLIVFYLPMHTATRL